MLSHLPFPAKLLSITMPKNRVRPREFHRTSKRLFFKGLFSSDDKSLSEKYNPEQLYEELFTPPDYLNVDEREHALFKNPNARKLFPEDYARFLTRMQAAKKSPIPNPIL